jgi:DNA-binding MarR family transcriptional regulator
MTRLDKNFFRVRFDRLTPSEKLFLRKMAQLGASPYQMGDVADMMKMTTKSLSPMRSKLIKKGMIYSPAHGEMAFTVPLFDEFIIRAIPETKLHE